MEFRQILKLICYTKSEVFSAEHSSPLYKSLILTIS